MQYDTNNSVYSILLIIYSVYSLIIAYWKKNLQYSNNFFIFLRCTCNLHIKYITNRLWECVKVFYLYIYFFLLIIYLRNISRLKGKMLNLRPYTGNSFFFLSNFPYQVRWQISHHTNQIWIQKNCYCLRIYTRKHIHRIDIISDPPWFG